MDFQTKSTTKLWVQSEGHTHTQTLKQPLLPVKGSGLPDEVDDKAVGAVGGHTGVALQLDGHLIAVV